MLQKSMMLDEGSLLGPALSFLLTGILNKMYDLKGSHVSRWLRALFHLDSLSLGFSMGLSTGSVSFWFGFVLYLDHL